MYIFLYFLTNTSSFADEYLCSFVYACLCSFADECLCSFAVKNPSFAGHVGDTGDHCANPKEGRRDGNALLCKILV